MWKRPLSFNGGNVLRHQAIKPSLFETSSLVYASQGRTLKRQYNTNTEGWKPTPIEEQLQAVKSMELPAAYKGPILRDEVSLEFVMDMIAYFKQKKGEEPLPVKYVHQLLAQARAVVEKEDSLVHIPIPPGGKATVVGDVHGQLFDFLDILEKVGGFPSPSNHVLFNGDFVDRGAYGVEIVLTLAALKALYPKHLFLNRGNHEAVNMNDGYGFTSEVIDKYSEKEFKLFSDLFRALPLAHVIQNKVFVVHGGLFSSDDVTLAAIKAIDRFHYDYEGDLMIHALWSDPQKKKGRGPSMRGAGVYFGSDVTKTFLERNNLSLLIRSHEAKDKGYEFHHDDKCITVFSAPNYCGVQGNKGAVITLKEDLVPSIIQFDSSPLSMDRRQRR